MPAIGHLERMPVEQTVRQTDARLLGRHLEVSAAGRKVRRQGVSGAAGRRCSGRMPDQGGYQSGRDQCRAEDEEAEAGKA